MSSVLAKSLGRPNFNTEHPSGTWNGMEKPIIQGEQVELHPPSQCGRPVTTRLLQCTHTQRGTRRKVETLTLSTSCLSVYKGRCRHLSTFFPPLSPPPCCKKMLRLSSCAALVCIPFQTQHAPTTSKWLTEWNIKHKTGGTAGVWHHKQTNKYCGNRYVRRYWEIII